MIRAVFDANGLASGFVGLSRTGASAPAVLLRLWMLGRYTLIVSESILAEVEQSAFAKPYFQRALPDEARARSFATLRKNALITDLTHAVRGVALDPDNNHVLPGRGCATRGRPVIEATVQRWSFGGAAMGSGRGTCVPLNG